MPPYIRPSVSIGLFIDFVLEVLKRDAAPVLGEGHVKNYWLRGPPLLTFSKIIVKSLNKTFRFITWVN